MEREKVLAIRYGKERAQEEGARLLKNKGEAAEGWLPFSGAKISAQTDWEAPG